MTRKLPKCATKTELAYARNLEMASAFDLVDRGRAQVVSRDEYPEPLKRFLARERLMIHIRLRPAIKRKLEARSREVGIPIDELAQRWIERGIKRDAV